MDSASAKVSGTVNPDGEVASAFGQFSPIDEYLNAVYGLDVSEAERTRRYDAESARLQELLSECMTDAGFEYIPITETHVIYAGDAHEAFNPNDRDWVTQYGYGAVNYPQPEVPLAITSEIDSAQYFDPNAAYLESLSESEKQAWDWTFYGEPLEVDENEAITPEMWENADHGCYGRAQETVQADNPATLMQSDEFGPLFEALYQMRGDMWQIESTFGEINREWSNCMADNGYPGFTQQQDANNLFWEWMNEFWADWDWETKGDPQGSPGYVALGEREVDIALADLDCRVATNYLERQDDIRLDLEYQFVSDHRIELEALRAAAEQFYN